MPPETPPHVVRRNGLALAYAIGLVVYRAAVRERDG